MIPEVRACLGGKFMLEDGHHLIEQRKPAACLDPTSGPMFLSWPFVRILSEILRVAWRNRREIRTGMML
jgi:hypothetical protein